MKAKKYNTNTKFNNHTKKAITSAVDKRVKERMKALYQEKDYCKEVEAYIIIIIQKASGKQKSSVSGVTGYTTTISVPGTLKIIIKQAKNQNGV